MKPVAVGFSFLLVLLSVILLNLGCGSSPTKPAPPTNTGNHNPSVTSTTPSSTVTVNFSESVTFSIRASDEDGDTLRYSWSVSSGTIVSNSDTSIIWQAPTEPDTVTIQVTITDGVGGSTSYSWTVFVISGVQVISYRGSWVSDGINPMVRFVVGDSIGFRNIPYTSYVYVFYNGRIECEVFTGGVYNINQIPPENSTTNSISCLTPMNVLTVRGGDGTPDRVYFQGMFYSGDRNRLYGRLTIHSDDLSVYDGDAYFSREQ